MHERCFAAVYEREHVTQVRRAVRRGEIDEGLLAGQYRADVLGAIVRFESHQFHQDPPLV
jgi:hypothetical protein